MWPLIDLAFDVIIILVLARVVISWLPVQRHHPVVMWIERVTEPMLRPFRVMLKTPAGGLDLAPMILFIVVIILRGLLRDVLR